MQKKLRNSNTATMSKRDLHHFFFRMRTIKAYVFFFTFCSKSWSKILFKNVKLTVFLLYQLTVFGDAKQAEKKEKKNPFKADRVWDHEGKGQLKSCNGLLCSYFVQLSCFKLRNTTTFITTLFFTLQKHSLSSTVYSLRKIKLHVLPLKLQINV